VLLAVFSAVFLVVVMLPLDDWVERTRVQ
jgi:hypothetical protein